MKMAKTSSTYSRYMITESEFETRDKIKYYLRRGHHILAGGGDIHTDDGWAGEDRVLQRQYQQAHLQAGVGPPRMLFTVFHI